MKQRYILNLWMYWCKTLEHNVTVLREIQLSHAKYMGSETFLMISRLLFSHLDSHVKKVHSKFNGDTGLIGWQTVLKDVIHTLLAVKECIIKQ